MTSNEDFEDSNPLAELQKSWSQLHIVTSAAPKVITEHLFGAGPSPHLRPITVIMENKYIHDCWLLTISFLYELWLKKVQITWSCVTWDMKTLYIDINNTM